MRRQSRKTGRRGGLVREYLAFLLVRPCSPSQAGPDVYEEEVSSMCGGFSPSHRTLFTTLPAKEEFACFRVAARVSEALRWSLEMSEDTWYG